MVHLILSSPKGNQGGKYFPYVGFLGLTPVRVEGLVRTKLDTDLKLLPCTSLTISVRCYEHRIGRVNVTNSRILVDHTQVLWTKPDDVEYEPIGVLEYPFRITLPPNVPGFSTAVFVDYRCTWRVEAILSHIPITGVGSRQIRHFELPLTRFDLPKSNPSPPRSPVLLDQCTTKPRAPRIRYSFQPPSQPIGPSETLSIPLHLQPVEPNVTFKNATVLVERRIQLLDPPTTTSAPIPIPNSSQSSPVLRSHSMTPPSGSPHTSSTPLSSSHGSYFSSARQPSPHPPSSEQSYPDHAQSTTSLSSSQPTITPDNLNPSTASILSWTSDSPLLSSQHPIPPYVPPPPSPMTASAMASSSSSSSSSSTAAAKVVVNPIVGTESDAFTRDARGVWSTQLTLEWPTSKSHSRWAIGETISSDFVTVKYFVRVKISVTSPGGGTDTIELGERELQVVSTSEQERLNAQATYAELVESGRVNDATLRSKSKSPRRLRPAVDTTAEGIPPSPAPYRGSALPSTSSSQNGAGEGRAKAPRRPHTSAGPRDKSSFGGAKADPHKKRRSEAGWGAMGLPIGMGMSGVGEPASARDVRTAPPSTSASTSALGGKVAGSANGSGSGRVNGHGESSKSVNGAAGSVNGGGSGEMTKKARSSSSGKLSSNSFWAVTAPPLKNHSSSSSSSGRRGVRSAGSAGAGPTHSSGSTNTSASISSVGSSRSGRGGALSSADDDDLDDELGESARRRRRGVRSATGSSPNIPSVRPRTSPRIGSEGVVPQPQAQQQQQQQTLSRSRGPPPSSFSAHPTIVRGEAAAGGAVVREWEEELARIEEKSRKESDAAGFGQRVRKRSFVATVKDLLPGRSRMFNVGGGDDSGSG